MCKHFPKPYKLFGRNINVKVDRSNYATGADIKNISHVDTSSIALKTNLATLKTEGDKLDIDKLVSVPVDLSKLSDAVKNDVVKKDVYNKLVTKGNSIDTSGFVLKTKYDTEKSKFENKIPDTCGLVKKTDHGAKIANIEGKIPDVNDLATKTALTAVENKIPSVSILVKKKNAKVTDIENKFNNHNHDKYIDTQEFNKLAAHIFNARIAHENSITKTDFDDKLSNLNRKITSNKTKHVLVENEFKKLKTFDSGYFIGKNYFEEDDTQNYLVFQPMHKYFKITNKKYISSWKSKGLSDKTITPYATSDNSLPPLIDHYGTRIRLKFNGSCLKQPNKLTYDYGHNVNVYIVYELGASSLNHSDPTLKNCLFGAVTLTKNADVEKYGYAGFGIGFNRRLSFSFPGGDFGQNVLIFGYELDSGYFWKCLNF